MKKYKLLGILVLFIFLFSECENKSRINEKIQITENIANYLDTTNYDEFLGDVKMLLKTCNHSNTFNSRISQV